MLKKSAGKGPLSIPPLSATVAIYYHATPTMLATCTLVFYCHQLSISNVKFKYVQTISPWREMEEEATQ